MAKKNFDLIVFDWDGTLMDSTAAIVRSIQAAAGDLGLPVPSRQAASYVIGLGLQEAMAAVLPGLEPQYYPKMVERYRHHYLLKSRELVLFEGVNDMLDDLSKCGYLLAVATGKSRMGLNRALQETKLLTFFDSTRCADESFSKPHPAMLNELTSELGQEMRRTVMIGDTTHDLQMATNAGASAIAVQYGAHTQEELLLHKPIFSAESVAQLHSWLTENA
jgi:phosphoglycolate phosphatase